MEGNRWVQYTPEKREASNKYSQLKQRSKDKKLELLWKREDFILWYKRIPKKCYYCRCTLDVIQRFWKLNDSKRKVTRRRSLEIDRLQDESYSEKNCRLACYWCNNAKSDVFTPDEFKKIGRTIGKVIKSKVKDTKEAPPLPFAMYGDRMACGLPGRKP
jgi:predicted GIY-YIG superfamily endonuclease